MSKLKMLEIMGQPDQKLSYPAAENAHDSRDDSVYIYRQSFLIIPDNMSIYFDKKSGKVTGVTANP